MTKQNKVRPFAVGDLIIFKSEGIKKILSIHGRGLYLSDGFERDINSSDILAIRKPRKGGKEARDIVARLARDYQNEVINYHNEHFKSLRVCYIRLRSEREWKVYDREKSMLGASDDN